MKLRRFSSPNYPWRLALAVMLANLAAFAILAAGARMHRVLADRPRPDASLASRVTVIRTPNGGIQPQLAVDRRGVVHLLYFTGDPAAGDLDYVQWDAARSPSRAVWSARRRDCLGRARTRPRRVAGLGESHAARPEERDAHDLYPPRRRRHRLRARA